MQYNIQKNARPLTRRRLLGLGFKGRRKIVYVASKVAIKKSLEPDLCNMTQSCSTASVQEKRDWEHFPHDADVGLRGWGATPADAFQKAACALTAVVTYAEVIPCTSVQVKCEAPDLELLFVEWLNAVIYEMAIRHMLFGRFAVQIEDGHLEGTLWGERIDVARHGPACEPKGATYTALRVAQEPDGRWSAACVVDV